MLKIEKAKLAAALAAVSAAVKDKNTIPALSNVLVERDGDELVVTGGNMQIEISSRCEAEIGPDFTAFTCPARSLIDIVRNAAASMIAIELIENGAFVAVKSGRSRLKLPTIPADAFPKLDVGTMPHSIGINSEVFSKAMKGVAFAAETSDTRPMLCGVLVQGTEHGIVLFATDGKTLSKRTIPSIAVDEPVEDLPSITIPNESVGAIEKILDMGDDLVFQMSDKKARFEVGGTVLITKLIDDPYPDWRRFVPQSYAMTARLNGVDLSGAVSRVKIATPSGKNGIRFTFSNNSLALAAHDIAAGEGNDEIATEATGELVIGFNGDRVLKAIDRIDGDDLEFSLGSKEDAPALLRRHGDADNFMILMPTAVKWG